MIRPVSLALSLLLFLPHLSIPALAQKGPPEPQEQEQVLRLKASLVEVRAVVTDKNGQPIEGLKKEDFEVLENGKPQELSFFAAERASAASPASVASMRPDSAVYRPQTVTRTIVLFVDTVNLSVASVARLKPVLKRFVDEQVGEQDVVSIVSTAGTLGLLQQFTTSKTILKHAIDRLRSGATVRDTLFTPFLASRLLKRERDAVELAKKIYEAEEAPLPRPMPGEQELEDERIPIANPLVEQKAVAVLIEAAAKRRTTLASLSALSDRLAEFPGQRLVVLVSDGFTLMDEQGEFRADEVQPVIGRAGRAGVVIYALDAKGLEGDAAFSASVNIGAIGGALNSYMRASTDDLRNGMSALALDTGGKFFRNNNDLGVGLQQVINDNRVYYAMAYYPNNEKEDATFRNLTVRVKDHPDYQVRAQKGYSPGELARREGADLTLTPQQRLMKALAAPLPTGDIDVTIAADYLETDADNTQLVVHTNIDGNSLQYLPQEQMQLFNLELTTLIYDFKGKLAASGVEKIEGQLTAERLEQLKRNGLRHIKRYALKPGLYHIRAALRESGTERLATAFSWAEIPDLKRRRLAMSSIQLSESASPASPAAAVNATMTANIIKQADVFHPKVRRGIPTFKRANLLAYSLLMYNAATAATATAQVGIYQGDKPLYESDWQSLSSRVVQQNRKGAQFGGQFKLDLAPGVYELRVSVKDAKSKQELYRSTLFEVE